MGKQRVEAFSDGVFAIAITLLVLSIAQPPAGSSDVGRDLLRAWPGYASYAVSFATIGIMWINHHALFDRIARVDRVLLFLNLLLLMGICFLPYPTGVLARFFAEGHDQTSAAVMYGATFFVISVGFNALWIWAAGGRRLLVPGFPDSEVRPSVLRFGAGGVVYLGVVGVAFVSPALSLLLVGLVAVYYVVDQIATKHPDMSGGAESSAEGAD